MKRSSFQTKVRSRGCYLGRETEAALGGHHLLQDVALDSSSADIFIDHTVLQMDVIDRHANQRQITGQGRSAQQVVCQEQNYYYAIDPNIKLCVHQTCGLFHFFKANI